VTDNLAAFPNSLIIVQNFDASQIVALNFSGVSLVGTELLVSEAGTPLTFITDPVLSAFLSPTIFDFSFAVTAKADGYAASYFVLSSVSTPAPEPGSAVLGVTSLLICLFVAARAKKSRAVHLGR